MNGYIKSNDDITIKRSVDQCASVGDDAKINIVQMNTPGNLRHKLGLCHGVVDHARGDGE